MTKRHQRHSTAKKREVVAACLNGEALRTLSERHDVCRSLIRIWIERNDVKKSGAWESYGGLGTCWVYAIFASSRTESESRMLAAPAQRGSTTRRWGLGRSLRGRSQPIWRSSVARHPDRARASDRRYASVTWRCPVIRKPSANDADTQSTSSGQNSWPSMAVMACSKESAPGGETASDVNAGLEDSLTNPRWVNGQVAQPSEASRSNHACATSWWTCDGHARASSRLKSSRKVKDRLRVS